MRFYHRRCGAFIGNYPMRDGLRQGLRYRCGPPAASDASDASATGSTNSTGSTGSTGLISATSPTSAPQENPLRGGSARLGAVLRSSNRRIGRRSLKMRS